MNAFVWFAIAFFAGSLPFSVWIGKLALGKDIRGYGDANPGATNVLRAGGKSAFALAALLDAIKAALPVGLAAHWAGVEGVALALVSVAPLLGHAFSPFLGFRGGKAVASTFGSWAGLTIWEGPTILGGALFLTTRFIRADGWAVLMSMAAMLLWFVVTPPAWNGLVARPPLPVLVGAWLLQIAVIAWKHRADLRHPPARRTRSGKA